MTVFEPPLDPVRYPSDSFPAELRFRSTEELQRSRARCQTQALETCLRGARSRCTIDAVKHCRYRALPFQCLAALGSAPVSFCHAIEGNK